MMDEAVEQNFFERETRGLIEAACTGEPALAGQLASSYCFDGWIEVPHDEEDTIDPLLPYRIVRRLRGGRDFDPSKPADWHVRDVSPVRRYNRRGQEVVVGTSIAFSRTFQAPAGYSEPEL